MPGGLMDAMPLRTKFMSPRVSRCAFVCRVCALFLANSQPLLRYADVHFATGTYDTTTAAATATGAKMKQHRTRLQQRHPRMPRVTYVENL